MFNSKIQFYSQLDSKARQLARMHSNNEPITSTLLSTIAELYKGAKAETSYRDDFFESAYHSPITGELEFLIARILYHCSLVHKKNWKIYLRRQVNRTAPDIRIELNGTSIGIIEIKAKAGWIQPFLSQNRFNKDLDKLLKGESNFDPEELIQRSKEQLTKYKTNFGLPNSRVFFFLPTLALVHRKKSNTSIKEYHEYFSKTSGLPPGNLILLSSNTELDLSYNVKELSPTLEFENLLTKLLNLS